MKKLIDQILKRLNPLGAEVERLKEQVLELQALSLPAVVEREAARLESLPAACAPEPGGRLRVAHFSTYDNLGGAAIAAWRLHRGLKLSGHFSTMLVKEAYGSDPDCAVICDEKRDRLYEAAAEREGLLYWNILSTFDIASVKGFKEADVVHFNNLHGGYFNPLALPGVTRLKPALWTLHDMEPLTGHCVYSRECGRWESGCGECPLLSDYPALKKDSTALLWQRKREAYSRSDFDVAVPSMWLKNMAERSILSGRKVHLVKYGLDTDVFRPLDRLEARKRLGIPASDIVCLASAHGGRGNARKGGAYFVEALKKAGRRIKAVSIGDTEKPPAIEGVGWISAGHLTEESKIAEWYSAADLFVCPSLADNSPLAVIEAMACGIPTVAFDTGGIPELVAHLKTGYVAKYRDSDDLARGICKFLDDEALRLAAGRAARLEAERSHTSSRMTEEYLRIYGSLIERRKGAAQDEDFGSDGRRGVPSALQPPRLPE